MTPEEEIDRMLAEDRRRFFQLHPRGVVWVRRPDGSWVEFPRDEIRGSRS